MTTVRFKLGPLGFGEVEVDGYPVRDCVGIDFVSKPGKQSEMNFRLLANVDAVVEIPADAFHLIAVPLR